MAQATLWAIQRQSTDEGRGDSTTHLGRRLVHIDRPRTHHAQAAKSDKTTKPVKKAITLRKAKKVAKTAPVKAAAKDVTQVEAAELAADALALAIHRASAEQRRIINALLGT